MYAIEVKNVSKTYNLYQNDKDILKELILGKNYHQEFEALKNISFNVKKGETYGVLGGNGSGKSTILSIINGTTYQTKGVVKTRGKVSLLNVGAGIIPGYTGYENIYYKCGLMGLGKQEIEDKIEDIKKFSELEDFLDQKVRKYSSGMKSKLGFAIAIHVEPDILIVDEALAVGDSRFVKKCFDKMNELKAKGITILFVSHSFAAVRDFCTKACWINKGEFIMEGTPLEVSKLYEQYMLGKISIENVRKEVRSKK